MARRPSSEIPIYAPGRTIDDAIDQVHRALRAHKARQHCETTAQLDALRATLQVLKGLGSAEVFGAPSTRAVREADMRERFSEVKAAAELKAKRKAEAAAELREQLGAERRSVHRMIEELAASARCKWTTVPAVRDEAKARFGLSPAQVDAHLLELDRTFKIDLKVPNDWSSCDRDEALDVPNRGPCFFVMDRGES